jgi:hypothetical protein
LSGVVFVGQEARLGVSLSVAQTRLSNLIRGSRLVRASEHAYGEGITGLMRVGPGGSAGLSRLVHAWFREPVTHDDTVVLTLRWEATGPGSDLFPVLDADITLAADGDQATLLRMTGAYRPPLGALGTLLDRAILHRIATATIQSFVGHVADAIVNPAAGMQTEQGARQWELLPSALEAEDI